MNYRGFAVALAFILLTAGFAQADLNAVIQDLNIRAEGNIGGFKAEMGARFGISGSHLDLAFRSVDSPADAAIVLWLGKCAGMPVPTVLERYRAHHGQGWGAVARSLGIKPGSAAFHALKEGNLLSQPGKNRRQETGKGKKKKG